MILIKDEQLENDFYEILSETAHKSKKKGIIERVDRLVSGVDTQNFTDEIFYRIVPILINEMWNLRHDKSNRAHAITLAVLTFLILIEDKDNINGLKGITEVSAKSYVDRNSDRFTDGLGRRLEGMFLSREERLTIAEAIANINNITNEKE